MSAGHRYPEASPGTAGVTRAGRPDVAVAVGSVTRLGDPIGRPRRRLNERGRQAPRAGTPSGDRQLLRAAALGEASAWNALVEEYASTVWSTCLQSGLRADEAAAVSTLVWMSLLDAIPDLDMPLGTWLVAAAAHEAHHAHLRAGGRADAARRGDRRRQPRTAQDAR